MTLEVLNPGFDDELLQKSAWDVQSFLPFPKNPNKFRVRSLGFTFETRRCKVPHFDLEFEFSSLGSRV